MRFLYTADVRLQLQEENPDAKMTDLAKLMGAKWKVPVLLKAMLEQST